MRSIKTNALTHDITIKAAKPFTQEELFSLLAEKGNFEGGGPEMKPYMGFQHIVFPGTGGFVNVVTVNKSSIRIMQGKDSIKGAALSGALDTLTGGFSSILNVEGKQNAKLMEAIGKEIERLVA